MKKDTQLESHLHRSSRCRGSALITSVIFSFVIGALAVTFLKLATYEYSSAVRATLYSSSLNLAESGVEIGIEALTNNSVNASTWTTIEDDFLVDRGFTGDVRVVMLDAKSAQPTIYSEGIVNGHVAGDVTKQVKVTVSTGFYPFEKGFSARNGIRFSGNNVTLDSYNSKYGEYGELMDILGPQPSGYGHLGLNKNDDIFVASDLIDTVGETAVDQGNADVYGYVTVSPGNFASLGPNGVVTTYGSDSHDSSRVLSDFYADFPSEPHPSGSYDTTYSTINSATTITGSSSESSPTYYDVSDISLSGNGDDLVIDGHVVLVMNGENADINVSGNGGITINSGGSLTIYTADDVNIAGNGVANVDGVPSDFYVFGTAPETVADDGTVSASQEISISGNGQLASAVYAPSANVSLDGGGSNGSVMGGVVGFYATITGGSSFHFDEALRDEIRNTGGYTIDSWLEMTGETAATTRKDLSSYF
ncbi:hypothetical protein DDZ13_04815 [Coraliomargarita sinensis]|uniref:DUF7305 domain-containing protein n=1 Tax=Coraliomargarita sinensis TaxID=2174842 RepID=A0A317ZGE2_9BACT|nr:hypothetical protein [Coraliomargarita sinensis]PXA04500.1 hypothetical protein DDZ13_04815 [Coraliomargarita sinensis]